MAFFLSYLWYEKEKIACLIRGFLFSDQYKTFTYKYALCKIILDNIFTLNRFSLSIRIMEHHPPLLTLLIEKYLGYFLNSYSEEPR